MLSFNLTDIYGGYLYWLFDTQDVICSDFTTLIEDFK